MIHLKDMMEYHVLVAQVGNANVWWCGLPDETKVAIYHDLVEIIENDRIVA